MSTLDEDERPTTGTAVDPEDTTLTDTSPGLAGGPSTAGAGPSWSDEFKKRRHAFENVSSSSVEGEEIVGLYESDLTVRGRK